MTQTEKSLNRAFILSTMQQDIISPFRVNFDMLERVIENRRIQGLPRAFTLKRQIVRTKTKMVKP